MKHLKIRTVAKSIASIAFTLALLVAIVYTLLTYGKVIPVEFNWLHLANVGFVLAILLVIALLLFFISCGVKKKDLKRLAAEQAAAEAELAAYAANAEKEDSDADKKSCCPLERLKNKLKPDSPKKIAMIAIPAAAVTVGLVAAGVKERRKRKVRRLLRDLERALGIRR